MIKLITLLKEIKITHGSKPARDLHAILDKYKQLCLEDQDRSQSYIYVLKAILEVLKHPGFQESLDTSNRKGSADLFEIASKITSLLSTFDSGISLTQSKEFTDLVSEFHNTTPAVAFSDEEFAISGIYYALLQLGVLYLPKGSTWHADKKSSIIVIFNYLNRTIEYLQDTE